MPIQVVQKKYLYIDVKLPFDSLERDNVGVSASPIIPRVTVKDFLGLPDPQEGHFELHHGILISMPPPKWGHQVLQQIIEKKLRLLLEDRGIVMVEMAFQPSPEYEVWQADVAFVSSGRVEQIASQDYLQGSPDLVVEVLSPSNTSSYIQDKMTTCLNSGCRSFWVIDGKTRQISVTEGDVVSYYGTSSKIVVFGSTFDVAGLF